MSHDTGIHPMITMEHFILNIDKALPDDLCDLCLDYYDDKVAQYFDDEHNYVKASEMKIDEESIARKLGPCLFQIAQTYMDKF